MQGSATLKGAASYRGMGYRPLLLTALLVFLSALSVDSLTRFTGAVDGIWIANAVFLAMLLKNRRRDWIPMALAGLMGNVAADLIAYGPSLSLTFSLLNMLEVLIVALPLRLLKLDRDFTRSNTLMAFYALAAGPAPLLSAAIFAAIDHAWHGSAFAATLLDWYSADALGLVIIVPSLMTVRLSALKTMFRKDYLLGTSAVIGVLLAAILLNLVLRSYPIAFLFYPAVLLLTFQRGFAGGAIGLLLSAAYLIIPALVGQSSGPLHAHSVHQQVTVVQIFIAVMGLSVVLVGAALAERRKLEHWLAAAMARAENSREEALVAKESAEKATRSKSMFLATMSHELRTPLNAVIGFAEIMRSKMYGSLGDERYEEYAGLIHNAGHHLLDLINDILDMSKIEAGKHEIVRERLDLCDVVNDGVAMMSENAMSADVALNSDVGLSALIVDGDRRAMKQIFLNLLSNAIKFTPQGGSVVVTAQRIADRVVLSVRDTGIGIPADQIYRLGNPFVQIRSSAGTSQQGTGLGLALVRSLAEMQDGTMKIESEEGHGTCVSVSFPMAGTASLAA